MHKFLARRTRLKKESFRRSARKMEPCKEMKAGGEKTVRRKNVSVQKIGYMIIGEEDSGIQSKSFYKVYDVL